VRGSWADEKEPRAGDALASGQPPTEDLPWRFGQLSAVYELPSRTVSGAFPCGQMRCSCGRGSRCLPPVKPSAVQQILSFPFCLFLQINALCNIRNTIPLAYRPLRNEDVADGLLSRRPADRVSVNKG
jgi:hypothetical protein